MSDNHTSGRLPEKPLLDTDRDLYRLIRKKAFERALQLLEDPNAKIPAGQLLSFAAKLAGIDKPDQENKPQIKNQNIFAILPGLPEERQKQILDGFEKELSKARKELNRGEP